MRALRSRAIRGSAIWGVAYLALQVIRMGSTVWLSHLLMPWAFGLVAIARALQQGLSMFSEMGIRPALIQSRRDDDDFVNTAWTLGAIRGGVIWGAATLLAYPMAVFYARDELVVLVPVLALTALLSGLESTRIVSMNRELREGPRAALEVGSALLTRATMIVWAYAAPGPWALVAGTVVGGVLSLVVTHTILPGRVNRFRLEGAAVRSILRFGTWIFVGTVIAFLGQQLDKIMLGKLDGLGVLGVYAIALSLAAIPREIAGMLTTKIIYPILAEVARQEPVRYAQRVAQLRALVVPAAVASVLGIVFASPWFFGLLYQSAYHDAAWIAPLACVSVWFGILNASANKALLALARTRALAVAGLVKVGVTATGCIIGYQALGVAGFVLGVGIGAAAEHAVTLAALRREGAGMLLADLRASLGLAVLGLGGWFAPIGLGQVLAPQWAMGLGLSVQAAMVGLAGLAAVRAVLPLIKGRRGA